MVEALEGLVTKSLLRAGRAGRGPPAGRSGGDGMAAPGWGGPGRGPPTPRFQMLETVREFRPCVWRRAARRTPSGSVTACFAPSRRTQTYDARWLNDVEQEHDNLRGDALVPRPGGRTARRGLRFGAALAHFWVFRGT